MKDKRSSGVVDAQVDMRNVETIVMAGSLFRYGSAKHALQLHIYYQSPREAMLIDKPSVVSQGTGH
jgi:hypothetical protein